MFKSLIVSGAILVSSIFGQNAQACPHQDVVIEVFDIQSIENGVIHGEIVKGMEGQGEGIVLEQTDYPKIEVGDRVAVTYDYNDYVNEIWDNILDVEVVE